MFPRYPRQSQDFFSEILIAVSSDDDGSPSVGDSEMAEAVSSVSFFFLNFFPIFPNFSDFFLNFSEFF